MENLEREIRECIISYHIRKAITGSGFLPEISTQPMKFMIIAVMAVFTAIAVITFIINEIFGWIILTMVSLVFILILILIIRELLTINRYQRKFLESEGSRRQFYLKIIRQHNELLRLLPNMRLEAQTFLLLIATAVKLSRKEGVKQLLQQAILEPHLAITEFIQELASDLKVQNTKRRQI